MQQTVLIAHVQDDWTAYPNDDLAVFEYPTGAQKAVEWVESQIPWEEDHMKMYFKGTSKCFSEETKKYLVQELVKGHDVSNFGLKERFPAKFNFTIDCKEVIPGDEKGENRYE